ncbi:MAG: cation:proton antiporter [Anaerolineales bacterium]|nr:cation:proton antiporter [Anaerolineales bacterium]
MGRLAQKLGQPVVIGEMVAGIVLGPSVLGWLFPETQARLFPQATIGVVYVISQVGLVLYMFLVGVEFQIGLIGDRMGRAAAVSLAGILAPFVLGGGLALLLLDDLSLFPASVGRWEAMLFMGAAISITAFPVLARILQELGIDKTPLGTVTLGAAAVNDVVAWCLLAIVLASFSGDTRVALWAFAGALVYVLVVLGVLRPALRWVERRAKRNNDLGALAMTLLIMLLMLGAYFTDRIGIHAVFGAFVLGVAMPRGIVTRELERRLSSLVRTFLLPLFFVYSGLNTQLGLVALKPSLWAILLVVLLVAIVGKGVACGLAAFWRGEPKHRALAIGTLMNARGLTELIILNIGLERGVIAPALFAIMVAMALVTTLMTTPLFRFIWHRRQRMLSAASVAGPGGS